MGFVSRARAADSGGNAAIEFALVAPVLLLFIMGIIAYGGYFWLAHNLQELANDAARAAIGGLTVQERAGLAQSAFDGEVSTYGALNPQRATVLFTGNDDAFTVRISYDAATSGFWSLSGVVPMPSPTIVRSASIRLGGY